MVGTQFDFSNTPAKDKKILAEHGQKTIDVLLKIKDIGDLKGVTQGELIPDDFNSSLAQTVAALSNESKTGSSSCRGACTGLCTTTCYSSCTGGCTGSGGSSSVAQPDAQRPVREVVRSCVQAAVL